MNVRDTKRSAAASLITPLVVRWVLVLLTCLGLSSAGAASYPALVDGPWLSRHHRQVVVLDIRTRAEFLRGHWPGARWTGFSAMGWQVERHGLPGYMPEERQLSQLLGGLGMKGAESVVVIGSAARPKRVAEAARIVWSLMMAGFERVALLDGGIESLEKGALNAEAEVFSATECVVHLRNDLLAGTSRVEAALDDNGAVVDFRPTPYFDGVMKDPRVPKAGTILDALGFPAERLLERGSGRFLPTLSIKGELTRYGIPSAGPVIAFSDTGVWGALGWFVLHRVLGNPQARLYDGSLMEWVDWGGEVYDSTDDMGGPIG
jgi:thiosulfate/3-mercaptopyruvate sulfurtransferase